MDRARVWVGHDPREGEAVQTAIDSLITRSSVPVDAQRISRFGLQAYTRKTETRDFQAWDVISDAPMSTAHAIARFFVPYLCGYQGWAVFTDGDVLFREDIAELLALADPQYAVQVVQHDYQPAEVMKMDRQVQTAYPRKNWSSVMLMNCDHPAHAALTLEVLNTWPGRDLHAFRWLQDEQIGALPARWNFLVGVSTPIEDPAIVHFTLGTPDMAGYEHGPFADEWREYQRAREANLAVDRVRAW